MSDESGGPGRWQAVARAWRTYRCWPPWGQVVVGVALLGAITVPFAGADDDAEVTTTREPAAVPLPREDPATAEESTTTTAPPTTAVPPPTTTPPAPPTTESFAGGDVSRANARQKAVEYLDFTSFSRSGLIDQLQYDGFSETDAAFGVDALDVDWNEQAAKKAAEYLNFRSFSRSSLIEQLLYEGFTPAQAEHGVNTTGL